MATHLHDNAFAIIMIMKLTCQSAAGIDIQVMPRIKTDIGLSGMSQTASGPGSVIGHHIGRFRSSQAGNNGVTAHLQSLKAITLPMCPNLGTLKSAVTGR